MSFRNTYFDKVNFLFLVSVGVNFTEVVFSLQPEGLHNLHSVASPSRLVFFGSLHALVIFWPVLPSVMPFAACTKLDLGHHFLSTWVQLPGDYLSDIQDQKHENNLVWPIFPHYTLQCGLIWDFTPTTIVYLLTYTLLNKSLHHWSGSEECCIE